eukprot:TRINITY_DN20067_c0_g1_i3.p1 TRINITY_DN20067_c0_g1~~TRINITY_DN20067_c0_g1_i3.p1  ORF type:complete len:284 (+),score=45.97 TRINITY_DN20067_c0_g1_i3:79-930(+)
MIRRPPRSTLSSSSAASDVYKRQVYCTREFRTYVEVLEDFKTARPSLAHLLDCIPVLQPRSFSIASCQNITPHRIELCIALVNFKTKLGRTRRGTCSQWVSQLQPTDQVKLWVRRNQPMRLPTEHASCPIIMVGPGTGVAPLRAMALDRSLLPECPVTMLFFGCRHSSQDWLYGPEMSELQKRGVLVNVAPAFSRDQGDKVYVQHRIIEHGEEVSAVLLDPSSHVFVAGSAGEMPKAVRGAFVKAMVEWGSMVADEAEAHLKSMEKQRPVSYTHLPLPTKRIG